MKDLRGFLENWVFGLFGFEERTFITVKRLIATLIDEDKARIHSTIIDYENSDFYEFDLTIKKTPLSEHKIRQSDEDDTVIGKLISDYNTIEAYEKFWESKNKALREKKD